jgi:hypothetical protein
MHDPRCPPFVELSMTTHPVGISVSAKRSLLDLELAVRGNNSTGATLQRANMQPFSNLDFRLLLCCRTAPFRALKQRFQGLIGKVGE